MKRPVFWAVVMFALGEVAGLFVRTWMQLSIAIAMLVCVVGISLFAGYKVALKRQILITLFLAFLMPVGCAYSAIFSGNYHYYAYAKSINASYGCDISMLVPKGEETLAATITGKVVNVTESTSAINATLRVQMVKFYEKDIKTDYIGGYVLARLEKDKYKLQIGDRVRIKGNLSLIMPAENPGQFEPQSYYASRKIRYEIKSEKLELLDKNKTMKQQIFDAREYMKACIYDYANEESAALYSGILLGDKTGISDDTKRLFEVAGISHILSISALHISLVAMTLYKLLRRFGIHFTIACPCAGILVVLYGTLTGWSFSAVRAAIMLGLVFLGEMLGRKVDLLTSASIALLVMSITNPYLLFDNGVCIGFSAVLGIAIGQEYNRAFQRFYKDKQKHKRQGSHTSKRFEKIKQKYVQKLMSAIIISISIYVMTAPVLARIYYSVSTYTVAVNLVIVPLMTVVIILGMLGLLFACMGLSVGGIFFAAGGRVLLLFEQICKGVIKLPMATIKTGKITLAEVFVYYLFVAGAICLSTKKYRKRCLKMIHKITYKWLDKRTWRRVLLVMYLMYFACFAGVMRRLRRMNLQEEIVFLSVGQGDGILLRTSDKCNIVIDGGSTSNDSVGDNILMPAIKSKAMHHIDYWIVSHADKDHTSGLEAVLEMGDLSQIEIEHIVIAQAATKDENTQKLIQKARMNNVDVLYMKQGERLVGDAFEIICVGPSEQKDLTTIEDRNEISLCFTYESDKLYALFTGDASADEMEQVADYMMRNSAENIMENTDENVASPLIEKPQYSSRKTTVLKVPHHGSRNSCIDDFYGYFDVAVVSCGRNNLYGHPHAEMLKLLDYEGCEILRTDEQGAITIR